MPSIFSRYLWDRRRHGESQQNVTGQYSDAMSFVQLPWSTDLSDRLWNDLWTAPGNWIPGIRSSLETMLFARLAVQAGTTTPVSSISTTRSAAVVAAAQSTSAASETSAPSADVCTVCIVSAQCGRPPACAASDGSESEMTDNTVSVPPWALVGSCTEEKQGTRGGNGNLGDVDCTNEQQHAQGGNFGGGDRTEERQGTHGDDSDDCNHSTSIASYKRCCAGSTSSRE
jgi:hypothetical protein